MLRRLVVPLAAVSVVVGGWTSRRSGRMPIAVNQLDVHPWFLDDVLAYYVEHPERRGGIGTPEEYAHLREAPRDTPVAVGPS